MRRGKFWTPDEIEHLRQLAAQRLPAIRIGALMGRSEYAIQQVAWKLQIALHARGWADPNFPNERKRADLVATDHPWPKRTRQDHASIYAGRRYDEVRFK
jgi:hypothetical protein